MVESRGAGFYRPSQVCPLGGTGHHSELVVVQVDPESFFVVERIPKGVLEEQRAVSTQKQQSTEEGVNKMCLGGGGVHSCLCMALVV